MRKELETKLFTDFPDLYETLQYKQFECADGWYDIIYRLSADIANIISTHEDMDPNVYTVFQVKEKWGTLRFYMNRYTDEIHEAIGKAEKESSVTCETCGNEGKLLEDRWVRTICDSCEALALEKEAKWRERDAEWQREMNKDSGSGLGS